jgi:hypothetical protein
MKPYLNRIRGLMDGVPGAVLGSLVYGAWAVYANWNAGVATALRTGALHWMLSAFLTYFGTAIMRFFYGHPRSPLSGGVKAFCGGMAFSYSILLLVHWLNNTPFILLTLAAGIVPNALFCSIYATLLAKTFRPPSVTT